MTNQLVVQNRVISLRGVEVHNLKQVDLDIPLGKLVVFCGLSGSGKTSLALDTLYAEGQRRYIESFSAYTRQFLERLDKPAAESITGIPPAIAVTHKSSSRSSRSTVGTTTETNDYLRLLFAKIGRVFCLNCDVEVRRDTPQTAATMLLELPAGVRFLLTAPFEGKDSNSGRRTQSMADRVAVLQEQGFARLLVDGRVIQLSDATTHAAVLAADPANVAIVLDRLVAGTVTPQRLRESLETAFTVGDGRCAAMIDVAELPPSPAASLAMPFAIEGRNWSRLQFNNQMQCGNCGREYIEPEPRLFSFNSPLGACPACEGFGNQVEIDMDLIVPDPQKSLRGGAIAPWTTPAYEHELQELIALAPAYNLPLDVPYKNLDDAQRRLIMDGVPERSFGGLRGFFAWLDKRKYKMHLRVFLSRWRSQRMCSVCNGTRLRPEALAVRIGGQNIAQLLNNKIEDCAEFFHALIVTPWQRAVGRLLLDQVRTRLGFLQSVGVGYLTLDRSLRTLSGGELQRVTLTSALGSSLVNMLYVLDEPSVGLHPADVDRLVQTVLGLRDRGNTVVVVEHEESLIRRADQVVEIGPGAGERGGRIIFQGTSADLEQTAGSLTGDYLAGRRGVTGPRPRREANHGRLKITGARGNNLKNISVDFPLGLLCLVTGVSGAGKSTLVEDTLYPALRCRMRLEAPTPLPFDEVFGDGQVDDVMLVDQEPIGRSPRSNPVTYIKAFDEIRAVFADTLEARTHNYTAGHFSFNVDGGRCTQCEGDGHLQVDMQFLADVFMKCPTCGGKRYRKEILRVNYRGRNIADVLSMTVREAFTFFRGAAKVQSRLKQLIDVGLDYLRLGQPANTFSGGEAQRLKLAGYMSTAKRSRTLFILDEPTTGLHFADVTQLLDCFEGLLAVGHSLIVIEHNLQMMKAADYIIDLGPGAADAGGDVVAIGTPEQIAQNERSATGRYLAEVFARDAALVAAVD